MCGGIYFFYAPVYLRLETTDVKTCIKVSLKNIEQKIYPEKTKK
jgi:hypothetical protein